MSRKIYSCVSCAHIESSSFNKGVKKETLFPHSAQVQKGLEAKLQLKPPAIAQDASEARLVLDSDR